MDDNKTNESEVKDAELVRENNELSTVRSDWSLDRLMEEPDEALAKKKIDLRAGILDTARKAAIRLTKPNDWVLFKQPEPPKGTGKITAYLSETGCSRVMDIFGISVYDVSMQRIPETPKPGEPFIYIAHGNGECALTKKEVHDLEGARSSDDDFIVQKKAKDGDKFSPASQEVWVRKMARTSLNGTITRKLTGLDSVPAEDLELGGINLNHCPRGRGFGSGDDRGGAIPRQTVTAKAEQKPQHSASPNGLPLCTHCGVEMKLIPGKPGKWDAFYGCPDSKDHKPGMDKAKWDKYMASQPKQAPTGSRQDAPPPDDEDYRPENF